MKTKHSWLPLLTACFLSIFLTWITLQAFAQNDLVHTQLSPPLVQGGGIDDNQFVVIPETGKVIYMADQETDGIVEIFSVPIGGGTAIKLNHTDEGMRHNTAFTIANDKQSIFFVNKGDTENSQAIYHVSVNGSPIKKLTKDVIQPDYISTPFYLIGEDGWLIYRTGTKIGQNQNIDSGMYGIRLHDLYSRSLLPTDSSGGVSVIGGTSNGSKLIYLYSPQNNGQYQWYSVMLDSGEPLQLTDSNTIPTLFWTTNDNQNLVYFSGSKWMTVSIAGGAATEFIKTTEKLEPLGISPSEERILMSSMATDISNQTVYTLYSVSMSSGKFITLSSTAVTTGTSSRLNQIRFTPDGQKVVFSITAKNGLDGGEYFYAIPAQGGEIKEIGRVAANFFLISPDSQWVVISRFDNKIVSIPINGGTPTVLAPFEYIFEITPDSKSVIYYGYIENQVSRQNELFRVPISGGTSNRVNIPIPPPIADPSDRPVEIDASFAVQLVNQNQICTVYIIRPISINYLNPSGKSLHSTCYMTDDPPSATPTRAPTITKTPTSIPTVVRATLTPASTKPAIYLPVVTR